MSIDYLLSKDPTPMEVIWQSETSDASEVGLRLIMDETGCIMFQYRSVELPQWADVDEVRIQLKFAV